MRKLSIYLALLLTLVATPAYAYIGPGAGAGAITVVFGVLSAIFLAFMAILWYPVKRIIRKFKTAKPSEKESVENKTK